MPRCLTDTKSASFYIDSMRTICLSPKALNPSEAQKRRFSLRKAERGN
jgi:hypothetical protein